MDTSASPTKCIHYFQIDSPDGRKVVPGVCQKCRLRRKFRAAFGVEALRKDVKLSSEALDRLKAGEPMKGTRRGDPLRPFEMAHYLARIGT